VTARVKPEVNSNIATEKYHKATQATDARENKTKEPIFECRNPISITHLYQSYRNHFTAKQDSIPLLKGLKRRCKDHHYISNATTL